MRRVLVCAAVGLAGCNARVAERPAAEVPAVAVAPPSEGRQPPELSGDPGGDAPRSAAVVAPERAAGLAPAPRAVAAGPSAAPAPRLAARPAPKAEPKSAPPADAAGEPEVVAAVGEKDLEDIRLFIDGASAVGSMPSKALIREALAAAGSPAAELVKKKAIVLTGATTRDGVWAYEAAAVKSGGRVVGPGGVETVSAEELRRRLDSR